MDIFPVLTRILLKFFIVLFSVAVDKQETTCYNLVTFMGGQYMAGKTQMEVASQVGISQAQVSRLEKGAINTIKKNI